MLKYTLNNEEIPDYLPNLDMEKFNLEEVNNTLKNFK